MWWLLTCYNVCSWFCYRKIFCLLPLPVPQMSLPLLLFFARVTACNFLYREKNVKQSSDLRNIFHVSTETNRFSQNLCEIKAKCTLLFQNLGGWKREKKNRLVLICNIVSKKNCFVIRVRWRRSFDLFGANGCLPEVLRI